MSRIAKTIAVGACALSLGAETVTPAGAAGRSCGPQFPGGQGGYHLPGSGFLHGAAGWHRGACDHHPRHGVHGYRWRGGFDGGGLY